jgi:N,N-dimethylformamidase
VTHTDRRTFLKKSAALAAASAALTPIATSQADGDSGSKPVSIRPNPPHESLPLPGLHAYAQKSLAAGEPIEFRVSSTVPYRLDVCRLAGPVDDAQTDVVLKSFEETSPRQQAIHPGSYVHVEKLLPAALGENPFTLECWLRPWAAGRRQGIITQYDEAGGGMGLFLTPEGGLECRPGILDSEGNPLRGISTGPRLALRHWAHAVASWDGAQLVFYLNGKPQPPQGLAGEPMELDAPLRLGAFGREGVATGFYDGDLAMPVIYSRAISPEEVAARYKERGRRPPEELAEVSACWPLSEEGGERIADRSGQDREGRLINHGTWMIGGPGFRAESISRYGQDYDPAEDSNRTHGLRLASDDLVDCQWQVRHRFPIPADAPSGVYVGRFHYAWDGKPMRYDCTFIVRRPEGRPQAPILMLCSTSTWLAYNCAPFARPRAAGKDWNSPSLPGAPTYCCYGNHAAGQPTYYLGLNRPWPGAGADHLFSPKEVDYSHLMRGELFTHRWLDGVYDDTARYDYDVITDWDLHQNPGLLKDYKTVIVNGHSEYWSAEAFTGLDRYLSAGGTLMVMSGNTFFWRTSYSPDGSVMECRKYDTRIGGRRSAAMGEIWHSQDGQRGSLLRECGYPEYETVGLSCIGWDGLQKKEDYGVFHATTADHFLFQGPESVGLRNGETFGHAPDGGLPHAVGHEWDVRLGTLKEVTTHIPAGATLPDNEPEGIVTLAEGYREAGGGTFDYFTNPARTTDGVSAELIYWERPTGGRIVHFGAIAIGWALSADPVLGKLVRNVLHHFNVPRKEEPIS